MLPTRKCKACAISMNWALSNLGESLAVFVVHTIVDKDTHFHIGAK